MTATSRFGWAPAGILVVVLANVLFLSSLALALPDAATTWSNHVVLALLAMILVMIGELGEITMPSGRRIAPVSLATGLTLATMGAIRDAPTFEVRPAVIVALFGGGQTLAILVSEAGSPRRLPHLTAMASRLVGVTVTALLARRVSLGGRTWWEWQLSPTTPHVLVALGVVLLCAVGVTTERLFAAVARARVNHAPVRATLRDEYQEAFALTIALIAPAPMATLLAPVLGAMAIPLALSPVLLTYLAVRRHAAVGATFEQSVRTLSRLTEESGLTPRRHAERVADVSRRIALRLGMGQREVRQLEFAALLHDLGQLRLRDPIPNGATVLAAPGDQHAMANDAAAVIRQSPDLSVVADLVAAHPVPYRSVVERRESVPLSSRILKVANAFDDLTSGRRSPEAIRAAIERIHLGLGYEYDPQVVAALEDVVALQWSGSSRDSEPSGRIGRAGVSGG